MFDKLKGSITKEMSKDEIRQIIISEEEEIFAEVKLLIDKVKEGYNKNDLFDDIYAQCENNNLAELLIEWISSDICPYEEMQYFRKMEYDLFQNITEYMFNNAILETESKDTIRQKAHLDEDNILSIIKLLNSIMDWVIVRRYTFNNFKWKLYDLFRFDEQKIIFLWNLYTDRKQELTKIVLLNNITICRGIKDDLSELIDIFSEMFDDENDEY